jgi:hypothetical protein
LHAKPDSEGESARGAHAEEERGAVQGAMPGHGDHGEHSDRSRPRVRFCNDDRPHGVRDQA